MRQNSSTEKVVIYPGSFDPITRGHLDIIERSAALFNRVVVGVLMNPDKAPLFSLEERIKLIRSAVSRFDNVEVDSFNGLLIDFARQRQSHLVVRGLRAISDFETEFQMSLNNKRLAPEVETMFMMTRNEYSFLSSSVVKQIAKFNGDVSDLVPSEVEEALKKKYALK